MTRNSAAAHYFFSDDYFRRLRDALGGYGSLVFTTMNDAVLAAAICIGYRGFSTIHLAGSSPELYHTSPCGFLFHHAQLSARDKGGRYLQMGGGRGAREDDSLFHFKSGFSPARSPCYVAKWILNPVKYDALTVSHTTAAALSGLTLRPGFFPAYQAPWVAPEPDTPPLTTGHSTLATAGR